MRQPSRGRSARRVVHAFREVLPPTLFFLFSFNLIVFTTNLLVHDYWFKLSSFLLATTTALVVGKAVLVVNHIRLIDRFRGAPLAQPILYKTIFYTLVVLVVRLAERFIHLAIDDRALARRSTSPCTTSAGAASPRSRSGSSPAS